MALCRSNEIMVFPVVGLLSNLSAQRFKYKQARVKFTHKTKNYCNALIYILISCRCRLSYRLIARVCAPEITKVDYRISSVTVVRVPAQKITPRACGWRKTGSNANHKTDVLTPGCAGKKGWYGEQIMAIRHPLKDTLRKALRDQFFRHPRVAVVSSTPKFGRGFYREQYGPLNSFLTAPQR